MGGKDLKIKKAKNSIMNDYELNNDSQINIGFCLKNYIYLMFDDNLNGLLKIHQHFNESQT